MWNFKVTSRHEASVRVKCPLYNQPLRIEKNMILNILANEDRTV